MKAGHVENIETDREGRTPFRFFVIGYKYVFDH